MAMTELLPDRRLSEPKLSERWRPTRVWKTVALLPFVEFAALAVIPPGFFDPLFAKPPDLLGIPFGIVLLRSASRSGRLALR